MSLRWNWGHSIATVYTVFAACTIGFVVYAMNQPVDLVSDDYYEQSVALDSRRTAEANARALGSAFAVTEAAGGQAVTVQWPTPLPPGTAGALRLYRPADAAADRRTPMAPDAAGLQSVSFASLAPGRWMLQVEWTAGGRAFYSEHEVIVPPRAGATAK